MAEWLDFKNYTGKHYTGIGGVLAVLIILIYFFGVRETSEERQQRAERETMQILLSYNEDLLQPVVQEEKTLEQLVEDIVKEQLGIGSNITTYKEAEIREGFGIFVESGMYEGEDIPNLPALAQKDIQAATDNSNQLYAEEVFNKLITRKQEAIKNQRANQEDEQTVLLRELQERLNQQN